ncbi:hypothetical protein GY45DRAFT_1394350 [Cubamyces sp. BRFM 1775]|nr:hypothetical protein GY45DRAFT_1394350 [Cubamyces sp. BRFM 1775]
MSQQVSQPHTSPSHSKRASSSSLKPLSPNASAISIGPSLAETSQPPRPPSRQGADPNTSSHVSSQSLPRITAKDWSVPSLCRKFASFKEVRRVSAVADPATLAKALDEYELDGIPLIIEDWHKHSAWPRDIFSLEWLLRTAGHENINVRNVHDRQDQPMTLSEFVALSRSQPHHAVAGETQRLYWKDADCPPAWRQWLLESGTIPSHILPGSTDDYLGYLSPSEAVESLLCYMGIGDTYTAAHKDLCASSGHNLMCFSEQDGSSFWFMTAANDAPAVARYFQTELNQELDWETHVTTVEELGRAPFDVYVTEQKVGDLVLVPPRSCHQVVNKGGLAMKTSWSRMTLDNLKTALHCELPIYRRVCRPEQYRVKTILYKSVLHLTEELQLDLNPVPNRASTPGASHGVTGRAKKLKQLLQLFDEVLCEEFASCHEELQHALENEDSSGWGLKPHFATSTDGGVANADVRNRLMLTLSPPTNTHNRHATDKAKERRSSCNLACDFCGADLFQSFFECKECRPLGSDSSLQIGDGVLLCPACYVEGRLCRCGEMEPVQYRRFEVLLSDRNQAARLLSRALLGEDPVRVFRMQYVVV